MSLVQILIRGEPVTEGHNVEFLWPIPPEMKKYKAATSRYLGHLLGHEGDGSLYALLKQLGEEWVREAKSSLFGTSILSSVKTSRQGRSARQPDCAARITG